MDPVTVARWQFGITTVYHYLFVPITIALSMLVAVLQTIWFKTGNERFLQLTKFFGKLFLINFALGVVTGIVQEFQFGMNWSEYSRFVGDVFGAPLAMEALIAFFLESTFIGLWIFGWDKLPKKIHLLCIYLAAIGTMVSAIFILAANSWMQNPVGAQFVVDNGRAELIGIGSIGDLLTNPVFVATFPHTIAAAYMVAGGLVAGISAWHLAKHNKAIADGLISAEEGARDITTWRWASKFGAWVLLVASVFVIITGDMQAKAMTQAQPMKMAAAEALFDAEDNASFSIFTIGTLDGRKALLDLRIPGLLSFISGEEHVQGINDLEKQFNEKGFLQNNGMVNQLQQGVKEALANGDIPADSTLGQAFQIEKIHPNIPISYWTFRIMIGLGFLGMAISAFILFSLRKGRNPMPSKGWTFLMLSLPFYPLLANSFGWIFTEMGRQPWLVAGVMPTASGVSATVSAGEVLFSLIVYTLVYGALAVVEVGLFVKYAKAGLPDVGPVKVRTDDDAPMSFAY